MAEVQRLTFTVSTNEDLRESFFLADVDGAAIDVTGAEIRFRASGHGGSQVIDASTSDGRISISPTAGTIILDIPRSVLAAKKPGEYEHDLLLLRTGDTMRVWSGTLNLVRGVAS